MVRREEGWGIIYDKVICKVFDIGLLDGLINLIVNYFMLLKMKFKKYFR